MTGWRVGFAIGNPQLIGALGKVKTNMDSGVFQAVQEAAITGLAGGDGDKLAEYCAIYKQRRDLLVTGAACARARMRESARDLLRLDQSSTWLHLGFVYRARLEGSRHCNYAGLRVRQGW